MSAAANVHPNEQALQPLYDQITRVNHGCHSLIFNRYGMGNAWNRLTLLKG